MASFHLCCIFIIDNIDLLHFEFLTVQLKKAVNRMLGSKFSCSVILGKEGRKSTFIYIHYMLCRSSGIGVLFLSHVITWQDWKWKLTTVVQTRINFLHSLAKCCSVNIRLRCGCVDLYLHTLPPWLFLFQWQQQLTKGIKDTALETNVSYHQSRWCMIKNYS